MLCLYFMELNLSNRQIALELDLDALDTQAMTEQLRAGLVAKAPAVELQGKVEPDARASSGIDKVCVVTGHKGQPAAVAKRGGSGAAANWQARQAAARWSKDKPPIFGLIQRGGQVVLRMLANVQQATIRPAITAAVAPGTLVHMDEHSIYARLPAWGYGHKTVCHGRGE